MEMHLKLKDNIVRYQLILKGQRTCGNVVVACVSEMYLLELIFLESCTILLALGWVVWNVIELMTHCGEIIFKNVVGFWLNNTMAYICPFFSSDAAYFCILF